MGCHRRRGRERRVHRCLYSLNLFFVVVVTTLSLTCMKNKPLRFHVRTCQHLGGMGYQTLKKRSPQTEHLLQIVHAA